VACNDFVHFIKKDNTWGGVWSFKKKASGKDFRGFFANCLVLWSAGEQAWEPLCDHSQKSGLWIDDPVKLTICAHDNGLLDEPGWKLPRLKKIAKTQKKLTCIANEAKLHSFCSNEACFNAWFSSLSQPCRCHGMGLHQWQHNVKRC